MPAFDADKALSDETYWFPKSLYNDDGTFILTTTDMAALNKYIWAGRLLPVAREEYVTRLGITNSKEIQAPLWQAVDGLLKVYAEVCIVVFFSPPALVERDRVLTRIILSRLNPIAKLSIKLPGHVSLT